VECTQPYIFRNYAPFSLQVPSTLSILLGSVVL
jgi:hypothetical protein